MAEAQAIDFGTQVKPGADWDASPQPASAPAQQQFPGRGIPPQPSNPAALKRALNLTPGAPKVPLATGAPPAPAAAAPTQSLEQISQDPSQALAGADPAKMLQTSVQMGLRAGDEESFAKKQQAENAVKWQKENTRLSEKMVEDANNAMEARKRDIQEASPFAPTKESAQDLASIFSLLSIAAFGSGGKGKYAGMQALAGMTGAMKGYKEGQKTIYDKEVKKFEENLQSIKSHNDKVEKLYHDAMDLMSKNKDLGEQKIKELQAIDNTGIIAQLARAHKYQQVGEAIKTVSDALQKTKDKADALKQKHADKAAEWAHQEKMAREKEASAERLAGIRAGAKGGQIGDAISYIQKFTGGLVDKKTAPEILLQARALGDAYGLKAEVENHPDWVGRSGQIKNFFNRSIESFKSDKPAPDAQGQPELVFAKRYAEYLVNYERSLAGGARGFTVSFQNRFNKLLEQNQFNPAGFSNLMDEQMRTIANNASATAPSITRKNLTEMALDIKTRAGEEDTVNAIRSDKLEKPTEHKRPPGMSNEDWAAYKAAVGEK